MRDALAAVITAEAARLKGELCLHRPRPMELAKSFDPAAIEARWYPALGAPRLLQRRPRRAKPGSFCIQLPPPNVTGDAAHGPRVQQTLMDALTRYHRMRGFNTLWQPGTDHAGIATQIVVERQLEGQGTSRRELGREKFVERVWQWKEQSGSTITRQMRRLGASCDWSRERFTMDAKLSRAVTEVFVRLYEQGLIYRGKRLVNWDPVLQTAVSDLEVESRGRGRQALAHPLSVRRRPAEVTLIVATTRPETMLGDVAVAVHPEDERYRHLVGKRVALPLADRTIPVIARRIRRSGVRHRVREDHAGARLQRLPGRTAPRSSPLIAIFTLDAQHERERAAANYRGLDRFEARKRVVEDLEGATGSSPTARPHKLTVPRCGRTDAVVEPMLTDQWFVACEDAPKVRSGRSMRARSTSWRRAR